MSDIINKSPQESALPPKPPPPLPPSRSYEQVGRRDFEKYAQEVDAYIDALNSHHAGELERVKRERDSFKQALAGLGGNYVEMVERELAAQPK